MLNGDEQKAQDFLQDICLTIIEKADYFNPKKNFSTWIFTIAGNMCKNEYRRRGKQTFVDNNMIDNTYFCADQSTETSLDKKTFYEFLHRELYKLDHQKKSVFLLRFQEQRSIKEISKILGCAEGTVKSRLFYTTQHLAKRLKEFKHSFFEV
jgi:RNA polymerase sigma-70 factor (ECF subfamily)